VGDRAWVRRILAGEPAAAEQLVTRQYPRVFRLLCHLTGTRDQAEDLAQQTFLKAW